MVDIHDAMLETAFSSPDSRESLEGWSRQLPRTTICSSAPLKDSSATCKAENDLEVRVKIVAHTFLLKDLLSISSWKSCENE